jgi:hypothetical protein
MRLTALWKSIVPAAILSLGLIVIVLGPADPSATDSMSAAGHSVNQALDTPDVAVEVYNGTVMAARDAKITIKVKTALYKDSATEHSYIDVRTTVGVVTLNGRVPSSMVVARAGQLTRLTAGVREVDNRLIVPDNEPISRHINVLLGMVLAVLSQPHGASN